MKIVISKNQSENVIICDESNTVIAEENSHAHYERPEIESQESPGKRRLLENRGRRRRKPKDPRQGGCGENADEDSSFDIVHHLSCLMDEL